MAGTLSKKYQPDFKSSMKAIPAKLIYDQFLDMLKQEYDESKILNGIFGATMDVELINDGPVTIIIESRDGDTKSKEFLSSSSSSSSMSLPLFCSLMFRYV